MFLRSQLPGKVRTRFYQILIIILIVSFFSSILIINVSADDAGTALEFDGVGEYVSFGDTGDLMGAESWTNEKSISLWLKPGSSDAPVTQQSAGELIFGVDYPGLFGISRANTNGQDRIWVWNGDNNGVDTVGIPYAAGEWVHIAMVHSGGMLHAYLNGELVGSTASGATFAPRNGGAYLGGSGRSDTARYFDGQIDEVRVWNLGLGSAAIGTWWDQELNNSHPNWSNLAAYYQMSDGIGDTLTDNSGNGRDGALYGGMGDGNWVVSGAFGDTGTIPTPTEVVITLTPTPLPTSTQLPATLTSTPDVPTSTPIDPTVTPIEPTATSTSLPQTPTDTPDAPTVTPLPPTPTTVIPTATLLPPTETLAPPTPTFTPVAGSSYALEFDGSSAYVALGDTGDLIGLAGWTNEKSISLWLKPGLSPAPSTQFSAGEMIFGVDYPSLFGINRANFNGLDRIWIWNADNNGIDSIGIPYTAGEWMHIAFVHTGNQLNAYLNGDLVGTTASGTTYAPRNGRTYIGGSGRSDSTRYFDGQIDEVRVWNIGLGSAEIGAWWDQELNNSHPNWSNLAAYYQMSNGAGVVLTDNSGNGKDGILYGGMGDGNWVASGAFGDTGTTPTPTEIIATQPPTHTPLPSATPTATAIPPTATATPIGPTATATPLPPTLTPTAVGPTNTPPPTQIPTATPTPGTGSGFALEFDGNSDFVELHQTAYMMGEGWESTKTVSLWVKPIGLGEDCLYNDVAFCDTIFGDRPKWWGITRGVLDGFDRIWVWNAAGSATYSIDRIGVEYTPDEWVHIALVHSNGELTVYKNGVEVGNTLSGATQQPNTGAFPKLHLGGIINNSRANTTFRGIIDEVQIWSFAQSESQIAAGMYQILSGSETGLSAYYRMSNGSGVILNDDSVNAWNGVLIDGARGVPPDGSIPQWVFPGPF